MTKSKGRLLAVTSVAVVSAAAAWIAIGAHRAYNAATLEPAGDMDCRLSSVSVVWNLGRTRSGASAGTLSIYEKKPSLALATPEVITCVTRKDVVTIKDPKGWVRQANAPDCLVDLIVKSPFQYQLRWYKSHQVGDRAELPPWETPRARSDFLIGADAAENKIMGVFYCETCKSLANADIMAKDRSRFAGYYRSLRSHKMLTEDRKQRALQENRNRLGKIYQEKMTKISKGETDLSVPCSKCKKPMKWVTVNFNKSKSSAKPLPTPCPHCGKAGLVVSKKKTPAKP